LRINLAYFCPPHTAIRGFRGAWLAMRTPLLQAVRLWSLERSKRQVWRRHPWHM